MIGAITFSLRLIGFRGLSEEPAAKELQRAASITLEIALGFIRECPETEKSVLGLEELRRFDALFLKLGVDIIVGEQQRGNETVFLAADAVAIRPNLPPRRTLADLVVRRQISDQLLSHRIKWWPIRARNPNLTLSNPTA